MVTQSFKKVLLSSHRCPSLRTIYATYVARQDLRSEYHTPWDILINDYGVSNAAAVVAYAHTTLHRILEEDALGCLKRDTPCISSLSRILDHASRPFLRARCHLPRQTRCGAASFLSSLVRRCHLSSHPFAFPLIQDLILFQVIH